MGDRQELSLITSLVIYKCCWSFNVFCCSVLPDLCDVLPPRSHPLHLRRQREDYLNETEEQTEDIREVQLRAGINNMIQQLKPYNPGPLLRYPDAALDTKNYKQRSATIWPKPFLNFHLFSTISITMYLTINLIKTHD